jgi:hypothetical protein
MSRDKWTVARVRKVTTYLVELRESGTDIRAAIRSLQQGIPADAYLIQEDPETYQWLEARHWITFVADRARRWIYVTVVESATEEID